MLIVAESALERLARIETKIDTLLSSKSDHETRIRGLEKRSWLIAGAAVIVSAVAPGLAGKLL